MQCCGEPFRVGQRVEFSTTRTVDRNWLVVVLGEQRAAVITECEDHHDTSQGQMSALTGMVVSIEAISCRFKHRGRAMFPMAGTTSVVQKDEATGWEPDDEDAHFVGYIVAVQRT